MRHEQTIIYERCIALMQTAKATIENLPPGFGFLADQLRRNTSSVAHNFAEGYYQRSAKQQRRYLEYAIQSAREASMSFDTARCFHAAPQEVVNRGKALTLELVKMLSKFQR
ncbi:MAG TPA: four helix bundle protein [Polyangiales bacterium]|nr:four helix bundle protein [Polyangiales bacterium]